MAQVQVESASSATELLAAGRRYLALKDYNAAVEALASACELLAKNHGDLGDECAEAYLWYGKALLWLSREESGVLGGGLPGTDNAEEDDDEQDENGEEQNREAGEKGNGEVEKKLNGDPKESGSVANDSESTANAESASNVPTDQEPGCSNDEPDEEANLENDDDVDNLQLAWEMLDLSRNILVRRVAAGGGGAGSAGGGARALLADVHLALGEVALESETYDKAVEDMQSCLTLQKELYGSDDRRIAETHYQIGLANSLASNFEDAITHFKNAANILETRIKTLENPTAAAEDSTVKKYSSTDPIYSIEGEIKELKELLPEIQEKIQDIMEHKAETIRRVREALCPSNGAGSSSSSSSSTFTLASSSSSTSQAKPNDKPVSDISHLIKRKRKASESGDASSAKRANT